MLCKNIVSRNRKAKMLKHCQESAQNLIYLTIFFVLIEFIFENPAVLGKAHSMSE